MDAVSKIEVVKIFVAMVICCHGSKHLIAYFHKLTRYEHKLLP